MFVVFAASMGIATFIENDFGTQSSKALVYNTWWFEGIMLLFVLNFIGNVFRYRLLRKEKISVLLFHLSFILIIVGAGITRYISFEAIMPIEEGESTNLMLSETTYLNIDIDNGKEKKVIHEDYLFSHDPSSKTGFVSIAARFLNFVRGGNEFTIKTNFRDSPIEIGYIDYIPNAHTEFVEDQSGTEFLHFVEASNGTRHDHFIEDGKIEKVHNVPITYNNRVEGALNIVNLNGSLHIDVPIDGSYMVMATQQAGEVMADSLQLFNVRALYSFGNMQFVVPSIPQKGKMITSSGDKDIYPADNLIVKIKSGNETENLVLSGNKYSFSQPTHASLNGLNFRLSYGSKQLELPFFIKLNDFQLERYPGSESPKSYASEISVQDENDTFDFKIFMNNVLDRKGYRFFQSSYDDTGAIEKTYLSVNYDFVGTWVTYIGYILLFTGLIMILMSKTTRFADLKRMLNKIKKKKSALTALLFLTSLTAFSQDNSERNLTENQVDSILSTQKVSDEHAIYFGSLVIQDAGGRMKPVSTFTSELLRKVSKSDSYKGMDANQVAVSMITNPKLWYSVPFIYMKKTNSKVRDLLGIPKDQNYARLSDVFNTKGEYKLGPEVDKAHKKKIKDKFEESLLSIDGRVNILYQAIEGSIFKFFPLESDPNNKWYSHKEHSTAGFKSVDSLYVASIILLYADALQKVRIKNETQMADELLESIHSYQRKFGMAVMPSEEKVSLELFYNKYDIFKNLFWQYMLAGILLFVFVIVQIFNSSSLVNKLVKIGIGIIVALFLYQTIGLGIRWYISGHAPWSNAYESMIYVAWATMFFGLLFGKKSALTIAATTFVVSMILMIAHWNWMDPSIGNLVPVLDSYWLMVHVAIIVASYGPFTLSMILGLISLILYAVTTSKNKKKLDLVIKEITVINEMSLTVGLVMLTIGNFLGGMWANESWGRYWGWDPKETWALVSIMVYAFVLHMRLVPGLRGRLTFNIATVFTFTTILMTYLGVNHLLAGLHSYAVGESAPIPNEIWGWLIVSILISVAAYIKYKKFYKKST